MSRVCKILMRFRHQATARPSPLKYTFRSNPVMCCTFRRLASNAAALQEEIPGPPLGSEKYYEPKIVKLVDEISSLTLREVADLNELLKSTLNIKDVAVVAASPGVAAASAEEKQEEEKVPERTEFAIKLVGFQASDKIKVIKALKAVKTSLNLVQAKKLVESIPQVIMEEVAKEECEEIKKTLEEAGGKVELV
ncbi:large ribosomal subunit protein bL12-like [Clavelina lepadiformis]|uniref:large ribosomal subunit protein bL12-like n=1 Tax=Clavelina lepadiformis TaxID=159417 RepID=UPI0040435350